jgi:gas vesicle protein
MSETARNHTGGVVLSFLAGAATGAAVALLTAPRSGRDSRRKLRFLTEELAEKAARVPPAVQAAYRKATQAGKEAFVHTLEEPTAPSLSTLHSSRH